MNRKQVQKKDRGAAVGAGISDVRVYPILRRVRPEGHISRTRGRSQGVLKRSTAHQTAHATKVLISQRKDRTQRNSNFEWPERSSRKDAAESLRSIGPLRIARLRAWAGGYI